MALLSPACASSAVFLLLVASFSWGNCEALDRKPDFSFSFDGLGKNRSFEPEFALFGDAKVSGSAVSITRPANSSSGQIVYRRAVRFFGTKPGFSSYISFSVPTGYDQVFAFFLSPKFLPVEAMERNLYGLSTSLLAVKIGTSSKGVKSGNHSVEIDVVGEVLVKRSNLSGAGLVLKGGETLHSWIDYNGKSKRIEVRLSRSRASRPMNISISHSIDLSNILWREAAFVGLSVSSINSTQNSSIYSWNFTVKHGVPYLMHSEPLDPSSFLVRPSETPESHLKKAYPWGVFMAMVFAAACGAMLTFFMMFVWFALVSRRPVAPVEYPVHPVDVAYGKIVPIGDISLENGTK